MLATKFISDQLLNFLDEIWFIERWKIALLSHQEKSRILIAKLAACKFKEEP